MVFCHLSAGVLGGSEASSAAAALPISVQASLNIERDGLQIILATQQQLSASSRPALHSRARAADLRGLQNVAW